MDSELSLSAPAKLNLFLHINGRRPDGYHELQTYFQILDLGDRLHFRRRDDTQITLTPAIQGVPNEDNLIVKAARLLQAHSAVALGADIRLEKTLPMGGGLGGGSSNAATTLIALNALWALNFSDDTLAHLGQQLGADVPVFVRGKSALANGIGEQLVPVEIPPFWYLILQPNCHVSTAEIFSNEGLTRDTPKIRIAPALEGHQLVEIFDKSWNDCQAIAEQLYPEIREAISWLNQFGDGRLTGTGACCFCRFDTKAKAQAALNEAPAKFKGFIAKGVYTSPAAQRLNEAP